MKHIAELSNTVVVNISVWDSQPEGDQFVDITDKPYVHIGWHYINGDFVNPNPVIDTNAPPEPDPHAQE